MSSMRLIIGIVQGKSRSNGSQEYALVASGQDLGFLKDVSFLNITKRVPVSAVSMQCLGTRIQCGESVSNG